MLAHYKASISSSSSRNFMEDRLMNGTEEIVCCLVMMRGVDGRIKGIPLGVEGKYCLEERD